MAETTATGKTTGTGTAIPTKDVTKVDPKIIAAIRDHAKGRKEQAWIDLMEKKDEEIMALIGSARTENGAVRKAWLAIKPARVAKVKTDKAEAKPAPTKAK